mmetsp:Transcript_5523/g.7608  ORF Transcript_5523/g.7608 Transcript_5523/m.7608 type:complete len:648 (-) Transcript_5523:168-2111(-)
MFAQSTDQTSQDEKSFQRERYNKIIELLISAGYYRARIAALSEFDKVIGGLCWCIASSGEALDIDILFQENLNIGKRIKLSERIVSALIRMNCPHSLQAHQIQGNDFAAILPVMIWMIQKTMVYREMMQESLKKFSTHQFHKNFSIPDKGGVFPADSGKKLPPSKRLPRKYRRRAGLPRPNDEETQVHSCLVEYGERLTTASFARWNIAGGMTSALKTGADTRHLDEVAGAESASVRAAGLTGFERELATLASRLEQEEQEEQRKIEEEENRFLQQMQQADNPEAGLSGVCVEELVERQSVELSAAEASYANAVETRRQQLAALRVESTSPTSSQENFSEEMEFLRRKVAAEKKLASQAEEVEALQQEVDKLHQSKASILQKSDQLANKIQHLERLETELGAQEASADPQVLGRLRRLVSAAEALAAQEKSFKLNCKNQLARWQAQLKELHDEAPDDEVDRYKEIADMHQKVMAKEAKLRSDLAEKNQQCSSLERVIDEIPSRTELIQYERRFTELYDQVNGKLKETRKYYEVYNTLDTTLKFLRKEVNLLNSISNGFDMAMANDTSKADFTNQFQTILVSVEDSLENQRLQFAKKISEVELLSEKYQKLLDEERRYFQAVKDFQKECDKNEALTSLLENQSKLQHN